MPCSLIGSNFLEESVLYILRTEDIPGDHKLDFHCHESVKCLYRAAIEDCILLLSIFCGNLVPVLLLGQCESWKREELSLGSRVSWFICSDVGNEQHFNVTGSV